MPAVIKKLFASCEIHGQYVRCEDVVADGGIVGHTCLLCKYGVDSSFDLPGEQQLDDAVEENLSGNKAAVPRPRSTPSKREINNYYRQFVVPPLQQADRAGPGYICSAAMAACIRPVSNPEPAESEQSSNPTPPTISVLELLSKRAVDWIRQRLTWLDKYNYSGL